MFLSQIILFTKCTKYWAISEISSFDKIKDNYPKFLLTLDYDITNINGIQKLNVIDWLLE